MESTPEMQNEENQDESQTTEANEATETSVSSSAVSVEDAPKEAPLSPEAAFEDVVEDVEDDDVTSNSEETPEASSLPLLKEETVQPLGLVDTDESASNSEEKTDSPFGDPNLTQLEPGTAREVDEEKAKPKVPRAKRARWYIIHTYSGHENKVKINLERRIESMNMAQKIFRVEVPQKTVTKIKDGKRQEKEERLFPGYVLVEMLMEDDSWYVVRHTPGVTKFVGSEKKPIPARDAEIKRILFRSVPTTEKVEIDLKVGENIRIISGPFAEFEGTVTEVSPEKGKIKASVSIFGRDTPVELVFNQVQKL